MHVASSGPMLRHRAVPAAVMILAAAGCRLEPTGAVAWEPPPVYREWFRRLRAHPNCEAVADWLNELKVPTGPYSRGAGDTWTPTIINLFVFWLWEIPLAYVLGVVLGMGPRGVFVAMTVAFSTLAVVSAAVFRRGHWKRRVV